MESVVEQVPSLDWKRSLFLGRPVPKQATGHRVFRRNRDLKVRWMQRLNVT